MAKTVHGVVDRQLVAAEWDGSKRVYVLCDKDMDNGSVVLLKDLKPTEGFVQVYSVGDVAATSGLDEIAIIANPEINIDDRDKNLEDYYNKAGKIVLADRLEAGNFLGMTKECFDGTPAVGKKVALQVGRKLKVVDGEVADATHFGTIVDEVNGKFGVQIVGKKVASAGVGA